MDIRPTRIFPLGDNALTVEFGNEMSVDLNIAAMSLAEHFTRYPFPGFVEALPAIASTTLFYKPKKVAGRRSTAFANVKDLALDAVASIELSISVTTARLITVPTIFTPDAALDLTSVARHSGLSENEVIDIFLTPEYRVFMLGFLPGFPYIGIVDDRIAVPRHATPRLAVPGGSVGIAGRQTGIYPMDSPGGWQIIGRTSMELLDPTSAIPRAFSPGDRVRFIRA